MNIRCAMEGHDWVEDYPGFETIIKCTKIYVCRRCGKARVEGDPHPNLARWDDD